MIARFARRASPRSGGLGCDRGLARLAGSQPDNLAYRSDLASSLKRRRIVQQATGRVADAAQTLRRAAGLRDALTSMNPAELYEHAATHARLGAQAGVPGSNVTAALGAAELDRAMDVLRRAVANGYRNLPRLERDPDLDPLRQRPDFRLLMLELAFPADPFARSG